MGVIVQAGRWTPSKQRRLAEHRNPGLEVVYVEAGRTRWRIGSSAFEIRPGDVFYTLPWELHGSAQSREPGLVINYAIFRLRHAYSRPRERFEFHPALRWSAGEASRFSLALSRCRHRAFPAGPRIAWLLDELVELQNSPAKTEPRLVASLAGSLLAELASRAARPVTRPPSQTPETSTAQRVARLLDELAGTCNRPWTLASMAAACGVGRTRFGQLVREQTGDTPILALNRARIARAEQLLRQTDQPITRIAHDCGFSSSQYFARLFREYIGESASAYRASSTNA